MLHTKFQDNQHIGSGEEDSWMIFTIYEHGGHLGHVTLTSWTNFRSFILFYFFFFFFCQKFNVFSAF